MLMVKPALPYLDVLREVRRSTALPLGAYNVSGEYAMLYAAAAANMIDPRPRHTGGAHVDPARRRRLHPPRTTRPRRRAARRSRRQMRSRAKKLAAGGAATTLLGVVLALETGCYDRNVCDGGGVETWGGTRRGAARVERRLGVLAPGGPMAPLPRRRVWVLHPVGLEARGYVRITPYVSADPDPNVVGTQYTTGAGNLGQIRVAGDVVLVINDTCEDYFVRVVVEAYAGPPDVPLPNDAELPDAGDGDPDASAGDDGGS